MKYYLIAGEASGDLHASNLMKALKAEDPQAVFRFFGGELMQAAGGTEGTLVKHYREMAFMGVVPVLLHARTLLKNMRLCRADIAGFAPDAVVLVDYPGFNLRIARFVATRLHIPVYYYISPKIWAWKRYRIRSFRRYVDRMFCILPFEPAFFRSLHYPVDYVGNPSVDAVAQFRESRRGAPSSFLKAHRLPDKPVMALLAGSRRHEIAQNLPLMLSVAARFPAYQTVVAGAPGLAADDYAPYLNGTSAAIVFDRTYELLEQAAVALVTSGTATLETALFRTPQIVCYHVAGGRLVNFVFRHFFHVSYISLVNLIAGREVVRELFGANFSHKHLYEALKHLTDNAACRDTMLKGYDEMIAQLGAPGASERTAQLIVEALTAPAAGSLFLVDKA